MNAIFSHTEEIAAGSMSFWFKPEQPIRYVAGQFIELTIPHDNTDTRGIKRWFTLSSSPTDDLISITTKLSVAPSTFKQQLLALRPGDTVQMSETMGDFVLPKDKNIPLLFIAGGIGVTPMHSMIKFLADTHQNRTIHLVYAVRSPEDILFKELFDTATSSREYLTESDHRLTTTDIFERSKRYNNPYIYLSGPEEMVEIFVAELKEKGVNMSRLVTDYFPGYAGTL